jgi:hypothetical protein
MPASSPRPGVGGEIFVVQSVDLFRRGSIVTVVTVLLYALLALGLAGGLFALAVRFLPAGEQLAPPVRDEPLWTLPVGRWITAEDVATVRLPVALRGYRFAETDLLLDRLTEQLRERDEQIARLGGHGGLPPGGWRPPAPEPPLGPPPGPVAYPAPADAPMPSASGDPSSPVSSAGLPGIWAPSAEPLTRSDGISWAWLPRTVETTPAEPVAAPPVETTPEPALHPLARIDVAPPSWWRSVRPIDALVEPHPVDQAVYATTAPLDEQPAGGLAWVLATSLEPIRAGADIVAAPTVVLDIPRRKGVLRRRVAEPMLSSPAPRHRHRRDVGAEASPVLANDADSWWSQITGEMPPIGEAPLAERLSRRTELWPFPADESARSAALTTPKPVEVPAVLPWTAPVQSVAAWAPPASWFSTSSAGADER